MVVVPKWQKRKNVFTTLEAYERLQHECLRGPEAAALLEKLRTFIDITGKEEL